MAEVEEFRWRPFVAASLVALALAGVSVEALPGANLGREPGIRAIRAKADAFVSGASRARTSAARSTCESTRSPTSGPSSGSRSTCRATCASQPLALQPEPVPGRIPRSPRRGAWRERKITFLNAPSLSTDFVPSGPLKARSWKAVDVTSLAEELRR